MSWSLANVASNWRRTLLHVFDGLINLSNGGNDYDAVLQFYNSVLLKAEPADFQ